MVKCQPERPSAKAKKGISLHNEMHKTPTYKKALPLTMALVAILMLLDFLLPGATFHETIKSIIEEKQQYYNAAKNYHYSYRLVTGQHDFLVDEEFVVSMNKERKVEYAVSPVFKEVNWYKLQSAEDKFYYSFRLASGLVLPLLVLVSIVLALKFAKSNQIWMFIIQVLLFANLVYLLL